MKWNEEDLDRFLDRTLDGPGQDPRAGLEERVMASLAAAETKPRRWWIWVAAPAVALVLAIVALAAWLTTSVAPPKTIANLQRPPIGSLTKTPILRMSRPGPATVGTRQVHRQTEGATVEASAGTEPRLSTFPSQTDEAQARLLLRFVEANPDLAQKVVQEEQEFQEMASRRYDNLGNPIRNQEEER